jgi:hypothetical protein
MSRVIKSPLDGTEVINFVGTTTDQNSGSTTVQDIADLASGGLSQVQSNETQAVPYTGVEVPSVAGVNIGDTKTVQFTDGTVVNYTWDGTTWVKDFVEEVAPKPTLTTVTGGTGLPNTVTFDNGVDAPTVFNYIEGARHDLRLTSPIIERGSDSATDPKGAQFLHDGYSHLNGYSDSWVSTTLGANRPVVKLWNSGKVEFNTNNNHANDFSFVYKDNSNILNGLGNTVNAFSVSVILNGYSNTNTNPNSYSIVSGTSNILNSSNSVMAGAFNNAENSTSTGIFGTGNTAFNSTSAFMSGSFNFLSNSVNSFVSGASINILNSKYCFAAGQQGNIYGDLSSILGYGLNTSSLNHTKIGFTTVPWLGQNLIKWVSSDVHFEISRGNQLDGSANIYETSGSAQNSVTLLKSGLIQFNSDLINNSHTQNDVTPISALEIVSTTKGVTIPRLTSAQISAWQASFNTTTDVTGLSGAGDEKHSRQGEMVYDLSTSLNTQARWNGTSWVFVTW